MDKLIIIGVMALLIGCGCFFYSECFFYSDIEDDTLYQNEEYTPSQNLAIKEGRIDEARSSILKMNGND